MIRLDQAGPHLIRPGTDQDNLIRPDQIKSNPDQADQADQADQIKHT